MFFAILCGIFLTIEDIFKENSISEYVFIQIAVNQELTLKKKKLIGDTSTWRRLDHVRFVFLIWLKTG